jgi:hypothetical protein
MPRLHTLKFMLLRCRSVILLVAGLPVIAPGATQQKKPMALAIETTVIPQMVDGGLVRSILIITNADATRNASYHINFYGDDGQPLAFPIQTVGKVDHLDGTLPPGASIFLGTPGTAATQQQGWAATDASTSMSVAISQILQVKDPATGKFSAEALIQGTGGYLSGSTVIPFDNENGNVSSMAMSNTSPYSTEAVNVKAVDRNGNTLTSDTISIGANQHTSFIVAQRWPELANTQGSLIFTPSDSIADISLMGLRFASLQNGFTVATLPVIQQY